MDWAPDNSNERYIMAKSNNGKKNIALAGLAITIMMIVTSGLSAYLGDRFQTSETIKHVETLKVDGCDPAVLTRLDVAVLCAQVEQFQREIREDVSNIRIQQNALSDQSDRNTEKLLRAIEEKP